MDRGRQDLRERQFAEPPLQGVPSRNDPGHRDAVDAAPGHRLDVLSGEVLDVERFRRPAARVQTKELTCLRHKDDREEIAAHPVARRLHEADRRIGRDGRVNRVAPSFQNLNAGARGERLARGHDAVFGCHH